MYSREQIQLPLWTAQVCCVVPHIALLVAVAAAMLGSPIDATGWIVIGMLCRKNTQWALRVPDASDYSIIDANR